jgi:hypothetical protein
LVDGSFLGAPNFGFPYQIEVGSLRCTNSSFEVEYEHKIKSEENEDFWLSTKATKSFAC